MLTSLKTWLAKFSDSIPLLSTGNGSRVRVSLKALDLNVDIA
jgi:hypothetical protein